MSIIYALIVGPMLALFVGRALGFYGDSGDVPGVISAIIGAMVLLGGYRLLRKAPAT